MTINDKTIQGRLTWDKFVRTGCLMRNPFTPPGVYVRDGECDLPSLKFNRHNRAEEDLIGGGVQLFP